MKVSPHPARALDYAPKENEDAVLFKNKHDLRDTEKRPIHAAQEEPAAVREAAPAVCTAVICLAPFIGSTTGLAFEHQREVGSVSG